MYPFSTEAKKAAIEPTKMMVEEIIELMNAPDKDAKNLIEKAYQFGQKAHEGQVRYSGQPYFHHPFETGKYLASIGMSPNMIVAGLLHDVIEDANVSYATLKEEFGTDIANLVEGATKLGHVRYYGLRRHTESLRKLFAATSQDVRVILVKLMDRLHNARTLQFVPEHKRERIALETLEVYAPIADRLGMGLVKRELEDAVFPHAYPKEYKKVQKIFKDAGGEDLRRLERIHKSVRSKIAEYGVKNFQTTNRIKGLYSLYRKLERKEWDVTKIFDLWALRIIVDSVADCYTVLGIVHGEWRPLPGRVKDYIAFPKPNGYRSIHTTIHTGDGSIIELQIRTKEMNREAQFGIASHFSYKESEDLKKNESSAVRWIRQFIPLRLRVEANDHSILKEGPRTYTNGVTPDWIKHMAEMPGIDETDPKAYLHDIKSDFFSHRIFIFTPRGDVIDLPIDSSPIDFAYAIHSEIGNQMTGAKINGKLAALGTPLKNGDIVEILTSEKAKPNRKWIGMTKTTLAKRQIRSYLQHEQEAM